MTESTRRLVRICIVAAVTFVVGKYAFRPMWIDGISMQPTYSGQGFNFCNRLAYLRHPPERGDVVMMRSGGDKWFLLKRVIAFAGETVEFRGGRCHVNGSPLDEPYVKLPCNWNEPPRKVADGCIFVIGDNRSVRRDCHVGGEMRLSRLEGKAVW